MGESVTPKPGRLPRSWGEFYLVLHATDGKQVCLVVVAPAHIAVFVVHVPVVGLEDIALSATPPVAVVADIDEIAIRIAVAARQSRKTVVISAIATSIPTTRSLQPRSRTIAATALVLYIIRKRCPIIIAGNMPALGANATMLGLDLACASAGIAARI